MIDLTNRCAALLTAALAAVRVNALEPELVWIHRWLDSWSGLGLIAVGMARQGFRLHLTNVEPGMWRATFFGGPMVGAEGFGTSPEPWRAVQRAG